MKRREFIRNSVGVGILSSAALSFGKFGDLIASENLPAMQLPYDMVAIRGGEPGEMFNKGMASLGGLKQFVKPNQTVVIKPNIGWDTTPDRGATTNPEFVTDADNKAVKILSTILHNLRHTGRYLRGIRQIHHAISAHQPDVVVNFYNLLAGVYSLIYRPDLPFVSIGHQFILQHPDFRLPNGRRLHRLLVKLFTAATAGRSAKKLALSFYPLRDDQRKRVFVVPPLLREELFRLPLDRREDFMLVYLLNNGYHEEIIGWHEDHSEVPLHCFWDDNGSAKSSSSNGSLTVHKIDDDSFLNLMACCKGVICTAGFETICEAFYLDKPVFVVPVQGHFEQLLNAQDAQQAKAAMYDDRFDIDPFIPYMRTSSRPARQFRRWVGEGKERFLRQLEGVQ